MKLLQTALVFLFFLSIFSGCSSDEFSLNSLTATPSEGQVSVSWTPLEAGEKEIKYNLYWKTSSGVSKADNKVESASTPYTHSALSAANTYYYAIAVVIDDVEGPLSAEVSALPIPTAPSLTVTKGVGQNSVSWSAADGASSYNLYWNTTGSVSKNDTKISGATSAYAHTSLSAANTYYYVITAVNASGESAISSESSAKPDLSPPTSPSVTVGASQNTISWTDSLGATKHNIYFKTSSGVTTANGTKLANVSPNPYTHTGLSAANTYYYVITAENADGESAISSEFSGRPKPAAPTAVSATGGSGKVTISFTGSTGADNHNIYYKTGSSGVTTANTKISDVSSGYEHTGLTAGTTYYYVVTAYNTSGESVISSEVSASPTLGPPTSVSVTPALTKNTISFTGATGALSYNLYYNTTGSVATTNGTQITGITSSPYDHTGLSPTNTYYYILTSVNGGTESTASSQVSGQPIPAAPTSPSVSPGSTKNTISWTNATGASGHNIYFKTSSGVTMSDGKLANVSTPYDHTSLDAGTTYYYKVTAFNSGGESTLSSEVSGRPIPAAPTSPSVTPGTTSNSVSWTNATGATGYNLYWDTSPGVSLSDGKFSSVSSGYSHTGLNPATRYYYAVTSFNSSGESSLSSEVYGYPIPAAPTSPAAVSGEAANTVSWTASSGASGYKLYWDTAANVTTAGSTINSVSSPYSHTSLNAAFTYYYKVVALNTNGAESALSSEVSAQPRPAAPTSLSATPGSQSNSISWTASSGATSYNLYWNTSGAVTTSNSTKITGVTSPHPHTGLSSSNTYYYAATAVNTSGESSLSNTASATPVAAWVQQAYLKPPHLDSGDNFGIRVAVSGDTVIVGASNEDSNQSGIVVGTLGSPNNAATNSGAAYIFRRTGSTWAQEAFLKAPLADSGDQFGWGVAIDSDTAVVGAAGEDSSSVLVQNGTSAPSNNTYPAAGAAYVFKRSGTAWTQEAYLKAPNADSGDGFGTAVSVSGDTIAVGVPQEASGVNTIVNGTTITPSNSALNAGAVYVYYRSGTTWAHQSYLKAQNAETGDNFGTSVAVDGDTVAVGASGEDATMTGITNGSDASSDNLTQGSGAVYVYKRTGSMWEQEAFIKAPNSGSGDAFGQNVSISGDTIVVGAPQEDSNDSTIQSGSDAPTDNNGSGNGAAYVFHRSGTTWSNQGYLKASNTGSGDSFGNSVSISGDTILIAASNEDSSQTTITNGTNGGTDDSASNAGAAYIFKRSGSTWTMQAYLKSSDLASGDGFAVHSALSADTVIVGAYKEPSSSTSIINGSMGSTDTAASNAGAAYIFYRQ